MSETTTDPGHGRGVLDTNAVVLLDRLDAADLPDRPTITTVTLAELSVGPLVTDDDQERAARQARLQAAEASFDPLPLDVAAARTFGRVAAGLRRAGRKPQARAFDALIAAIAIANELPLYTCNEGGFAGIPELRLRPIPHPDQN